MMSRRAALFKLALAHEEDVLRSIVNLLFSDEHGTAWRTSFLDLERCISTEASWRLLDGSPISADLVYEAFYDWPFVGNEVGTLTGIARCLKAKGFSINRKFTDADVLAVRDVIIACADIVASGTFEDEQFERLEALIKHKRSSLA